jgi:hypothetical protein
MSGLSFSATRVVEMAFKTTETFPETTARLLEEASQVKTSGVMVSSKRALTNLMASRVCLELRIRFPASSCS